MLTGSIFRLSKVESMATGGLIFVSGLSPPYPSFSIQLQEVKALKRFRAQVQAYLGGPKHYLMYGEDIGVVGSSKISQSFGSISITIFARATDVHEGVFEVIGTSEQIPQGVNVGLFKAGNKGGVCLPFRFHGSTMVVLGAHLPADGSHGSRIQQRHATLYSTLRDATSSMEDFDLHLQVRTLSEGMIDRCQFECFGDVSKRPCSITAS